MVDDKTVCPEECFSSTDAWSALQGGCFVVFSFPILMTTLVARTMRSCTIWCPKNRVGLVGTVLLSGTLLYVPNGSLVERDLAVADP